MRNLTICLITLLITDVLRAQPQLYSLSGSVKDSTTGKPIPAVSVFLDGTSKGTTARDDGTFVIEGIPPGGYRLIISAIGYATFHMTISTRQLPPNLNVALYTQASALASVTVEPANNDDWNKWGSLFWDNFIGTNQNASFCTLENRNALRFHYHPKTKKLTVRAVEPLIIVNKALGYRIDYCLESFSYDLAIDTFSFYGYPFFRQLIPDDDVQRQDWEGRRRLAYLGSRMHFMRSLYSGHLRQEGFTIEHEIKRPNIEKERVRAIYNPQNIAGIPRDSLRHYRKVLREPDTVIKTMRNYDSLVTVNPDQTRSFYFTGDFTVYYSNMDLRIPPARSKLELSYPVPIQIEENGSFLPVLSLFTTGEWVNTGKIANLLPWDYYLPSPERHGFSK